MMKYMFTVWRIENSDGRGMWYNLKQECDPVEIEYIKSFPMPYSEQVEFYHWYSGTISIDQLYEWFSREVIDELVGLGYRIMKYEVQSVVEINNQVYFCKSDNVFCKYDITDEFLGNVNE